LAINLVLILLRSAGCFHRLEEAVVPTTTSTLVPPRAALVECARHTRPMEDDLTVCELARNETWFNYGEGEIKHVYPPEFVYPMAFLLILVSTKCTEHLFMSLVTL
jgi:hypothetical protein